MADNRDIVREDREVDKADHEVEDKVDHKVVDTQVVHGVDDVYTLHHRFA